MKSGQTVLIHSACGGVGQAAIQIARYVGANLICTAGTPEKRTYLHRICGIEHVGDSRSSSFHDDVMHWTAGKGVDIVLNSLHGYLLEQSVKCLAHGGKFCEIGKRDILSNASLSMGPLLENISFLSVHLDMMMVRCPSEFKSIAEKVMALLNSKDIFPVRTVQFPISECSDAFKYMKTGGHIGKIVVTIPEGFSPDKIYPPAEIFSKDAMYVITGGLGGIGRALAEWMVDKGVRHICLVSRGGVKSFFQRSSIKRMEQNGATVYTVQADVSKTSEVERLFQQLREAPDVKGIFHLAAHIEDIPALHMTPDVLQKTLSAKAVGAENLHLVSYKHLHSIYVLQNSVGTMQVYNICIFIQYQLDCICSPP